MKPYKTALYIFRRDLRLHDNSALNAALTASQYVLPAFIFDPAQIQPHPYQSKPGLLFMMQALADLQQQLHDIGSNLALFYDNPEQAIRTIVSEHPLQAIFVNRDYTPFSRFRDEALLRTCLALEIPLHIVPDYLLTEPEQTLKSDDTPYKVFTAFYLRAKQIPVTLPKTMVEGNFLSINTAFTLHQLPITLPTTELSNIHGGRIAALQVLDQIQQCQDYANTRDFPALNATSLLSVHLKFGTCSVREVYFAIYARLGSGHALLRQLYWRDFFTHIAYHFPEVFGRAFIQKLANLPFDNNRLYFQAWATGKTGFPIVDAGMRELNATGFMHNRVRMIVASFLVKDLHISWRWGERYFAQHLVDYDPCVNNGNWQWAASTGCDAQPYFRIFNPWLQQQKFDAECRYIYQWLPELKNVAVKTIHHWYAQHVEGDYPAPIINHAEEVAITKQLYKQTLAFEVS